MHFTIRLVRFVGAAMLMCASLPGLAQWTPAKPIRVVIPYGAGGAADICIRTLAEKMARSLGQSMVMENRAGAGGAIGTEIGARAPADGYTLVVGSDAAFSIIPNLQKTSYDPIKDFEPVALMAVVPLVLVVHPSVAAKSVQELVALAKSSSTKLTIASNGNGSSGHLSAELFKSTAKIDLLHVPYKGMGPVITDVLGGQVMMTFSSLGPVEQHIKSGKLKALAITIPTRFPGLPNVPTMVEAGFPDFDVSVWLSLFAPQGTPKPIVARLNTEVAKALDDPEVKEKFASLGYVPVGGAPGLAMDRARQDLNRWGEVIRNAKITAE